MSNGLYLFGEVLFDEFPDGRGEMPAAAPSCALLYHGSLALRDEVSRRTMDRLRAGEPETVFIDVNLRPPWWSRERLLAGLTGPQWVKLDHHELDMLADGDSPDARVSSLIETHGLEGVLVTSGKAAAAIYTAKGEVFETRPRPAIEVVDTVGAGDALASVMILGMLRGWAMQTALDRTQSFASAIVGRRGATVRDSDFYAPFIAAWAR